VPTGGASASRARRPYVWTDDQIRRRLETFLAGRDEWPRKREFVEAGNSLLWRVVAKYGGTRHWAAQLGVTYVERRGGLPPWTKERVRLELAPLLAGREHFPSATEVRQGAGNALWRAILRTGGPDRWAAEFGLPRANRRAGSQRSWTDERIERELRRFLANRDEWPSAGEFNDANLASLFTAIYTYGGVELWAARMNVSLRPPRNSGRPRRYWTAERIRTQLTSFCAERENWPRVQEFQTAGLIRLYWAASRHGGVAYWSRELGLSSERPHRRVAAA
jgi:hypothetical protein